TRVKDVNELVRTVFRGGCTDLTCSRTPPVLKEVLDGLGSLFDEDAMFIPGAGQEPVCRTR
ncbi:hypothetical protein ADK36_10115, partial [Streptomyces viridochromogenes]